MRRKLVLIAASTALATVVWFLAVDSSWFVENCPTCGYGRDIFQYRILTQPVSERTREYFTPLQLIATELGVECRHPKLQHYHKYHLWGLCICGNPRISGTVRLVGDLSWYDDPARTRIRNLAKTNPSLPGEFAELVMKNRDCELWGSILEQAKAASHTP